MCSEVIVPGFEILLYHLVTVTLASTIVKRAIKVILTLWAFFVNYLGTNMKSA